MFLADSLLIGICILYPVCGPSRASLLSGRRPDSTQMWNFVGGFRQTAGADKWNTWPQWFLKKGYYTAGEIDAHCARERTSPSDLDSALVL